jgi:hypothetical protein
MARLEIEKREPLARFLEKQSSAIQPRTHVAISGGCLLPAAGHLTWLPPSLGDQADNRDKFSVCAG